MDRAEKKPLELRRWFLFGLYMGLGGAFLKTILTDVLSVGGPLAYALSFFITSTLAFPLFIRGTVNPWAGDKRPWTFLPWLITDLALAFASYWVARYFQLK